MKRFAFDLEKILDLRKHREQEAKIALGRAVGELTNIENQLKELALLRSKAAGEYLPPSALTVLKQESPIQFPFSAAYYRNHEFYIRRLEHRKEELLEEAARAQLELEEKRTLYLEASRERKILDKLKEKRSAEYRRNLFAGETKTLDDMAGRRNGEGR
ncbi:MAG: flagellar export protein FliJ [Treponema sp.]|jgi:flagellar FliJ protein|nr:flagellar export protein FliJ [Treponema sp.]